MEGKTLARIGAIVFVAFAMTATVIELTREEEPSRAAPAPAFAPSVDPLRAEQRRCQRLGEAEGEALRGQGVHERAERLPERVFRGVASNAVGHGRVGGVERTS